MQEVRVDLWDLDRGALLSSDRKTETLQKIQELVGLTFEQFCRSVLLAQGEFAQFLRLKGDARADLLEKMTGTAIYAQLSRAAFERHKQEVESLNTLRAQRAAPDLLSETERAALTTDPQYNMTLGSAHLADLVDSFNGSYVLAIASYNAGAFNARDWIADWGDPRSPNVDVVDWIELIPFSETRNYVQRVTENLQVYRYRLAGHPTPITLEQDLKRGG